MCFEIFWLNWSIIPQLMNHSILKLLAFYRNLISTAAREREKKVIPYSFPENNPVWFTPQHWNAFTKTSFFTTGLPFPRVWVSLCVCVSEFHVPGIKIYHQIIALLWGNLLNYTFAGMPRQLIPLRTWPGQLLRVESWAKVSQNPPPLRTGLVLGGKTRPNAKWKFMRCGGPPQIIHPSTALS